jgi:hypothetical protein
MSDAKHDAKHDTQHKARHEAEAAAIRRRWINLGELLAVIAVIISGLTLWNSWSERHDNEAKSAAESQHATTRAGTLTLIASTGGHELLLKPASADQSIQGQTLVFPKALGVAPAETTGEPRIEASWFEHALKAARGAAGLPGDSRGDERLPVAITTRFLVDGEAREEVALYDIGYTISDGGLFGGHTVTLRGLSLVSRVKASGAQAALDARWQRLLAKKA